jgi:hypothetical protein
MKFGPTVKARVGVEEQRRSNLDIAGLRYVAGIAVGRRGFRDD